MTPVGAGTVRTLSCLPSGQLSVDGQKTFSYDGEGRMEESFDDGMRLASYAFDASGQRVSKTTTSTEIHFIQDKEGRLLAEHDGNTGAPLRDYIWLGMMPVAMVDYSSGTPTTYYIHTDHVMNPQKMTDSSGAVVWDRVATPFNVEVMVTGALTQPLKFPGQFEDTETTLFQNWNRDYDTSLGRYVQSDPIGLMGGINTYAYVEGNPLSAVDQKGLNSLISDGPGVQGANSTANMGITAAIIERNRSQIDDLLQNGGLWEPNRDKRFHYQANCEAAQLGGEFEAYSKIICDIRENYQRGVSGSSAQDAIADQQANARGRELGRSNPQQSCRQLCGNEFGFFYGDPEISHSPGQNSLSQKSGSGRSSFDSN